MELQIAQQVGGKLGIALAHAEQRIQPQVRLDRARASPVAKVAGASLADQRPPGLDPGPQLVRRLDNPALDVRADDVLVLKGIGPIGAPGMPEAGLIPIPRKLARAGVKDMVRISDGRMSGTAAGTIVLHVTPESAAGGPLALVHDGDTIRLSVASRTLTLEVDDAELARRAARRAPAASAAPERGYRGLFVRSVTQADRGCDFDFLRAGTTRATVPRAPGER